MKRFALFLIIPILGIMAQTMDYNKQLKNQPVISDTTFATLAAACTAVPANAVLTITKTWLNTPTQTLNCQLRWNGGTVQVATNATVTFNNTINCPDGQKCVDSTTNSGARILVNKRYTKEVNPRMWGTGLGGDDTALMHAAALTAAESRVGLGITPGTYLVDNVFLTSTFSDAGETTTCIPANTTIPIIANASAQGIALNAYTGVIPSGAQTLFVGTGSDQEVVTGTMSGAVFTGIFTFTHPQFAPVELASPRLPSCLTPLYITGTDKTQFDAPVFKAISGAVGPYVVNVPSAKQIRVSDFNVDGNDLVACLNLAWYALLGPAVQANYSRINLNNCVDTNGMRPHLNTFQLEDSSVEEITIGTSFSSTNTNPGALVAKGGGGTSYYHHIAAYPNNSDCLTNPACVAPSVAGFVQSQGQNNSFDNSFFPSGFKVESVDNNVTSGSNIQIGCNASTHHAIQSIPNPSFSGAPGPDALIFTNAYIAVGGTAAGCSSSIGIISGNFDTGIIFQGFHFGTGQLFDTSAPAGATIPHFHFDHGVFEGSLPAPQANFTQSFDSVNFGGTYVRHLEGGTFEHQLQSAIVSDRWWCGPYNTSSSNSGDCIEGFSTSLQHPGLPDWALGSYGFKGRSLLLTTGTDNATNVSLINWPADNALTSWSLVLPPGGGSGGIQFNDGVHSSFSLPITWGKTSVNLGVNSTLNSSPIVTAPSHGATCSGGTPHVTAVTVDATTGILTVTCGS